MIDWILAERIAAYVAGSGNGKTADGRPGGARRRVRGAGRSPTRASSRRGRFPPPEGIGRREWVAEQHRRDARAARSRARSATGEGLGPLRPAIELGDGRRADAPRSASCSATWPSACSASTSSCCSTRPSRTGRRGCCSCSRTSARRSQAFGADEQEFMTWVTLHEVTHAVQFAGVPWLQGHVAGLVRELLAQRRAADRGAAQAADADGRGAAPDRRRAAPRRPDLDRHRRRRARDARPGAGGDGGDRGPRRARDGRGRARPAAVAAAAAGGARPRRRKSQSGLSRLLARLLGLEHEAPPVRARQDTSATRSCEARGVEALHHVFSSPEALPTLAELEDPAAWLNADGPRRRRRSAQRSSA